MVEPDIIGDLTLMVAELLENAVSFSPAGSPVEVTVRTRAEGAVIEVADHGLGMSAERLAEENARLVRRERLDVVPTKVLGLFVVGTLARRWEVRVVLSRTPGGGVTATVEIPSMLLLTMSPVDAPEPEPTASATTGPESAAAVSGPVPSAVVAPADVPAEQAPAGAEDRPDALPRRLPRHQQHEVGEAAGDGHERADRTESRLPDGTGALDHSAPHDPAEELPLVPRPRTEGTAPAPGARTPESAHAVAEAAPGTPRPLRRRVRGATLPTTASDTGRQAASRAPRPADADEVRSALDEFEAAVERANRDTATRTTPHRTHDQNHLQEGAEQ
jgi:anti-sigma regulatory factor (Ser/Thr protein kinase)